MRGNNNILSGIRVRGTVDRLPGFLPRATNTTCINTEEDCTRPAYARGMCSLHYRRLMRRLKLEREGQPAPKVKPVRPQILCRICGEPARARELCRKHYIRWRTGRVLVTPEERGIVIKPRCMEPGCDRLVHARGLCERHYVAKYQDRAEYQARRRAARAKVRQEQQHAASA